MGKCSGHLCRHEPGWALAPAVQGRRCGGHGSPRAVIWRFLCCELRLNERRDPGPPPTPAPSPGDTGLGEVLRNWEEGQRGEDHTQGHSVSQGPGATLCPQGQWLAATFCSEQMSRSPQRPEVVAVPGLPARPSGPDTVLPPSARTPGAPSGWVVRRGGASVGSPGPGSATWGFDPGRVPQALSPLLIYPRGWRS